MELHSGKATRICRGMEGFRAKIIAATALYNLKVDENNIDYETEWLHADGFVYCDDDLWKVEDTKHEDGIIKATKVGRDTFEYVLHYYNGGVNFEEALKEAVNKTEGK